MRRRLGGLTLALVILGALVGLQGDSARAWKPYTHNFIGDNAYADAVDDGMVTINGVEYPVPEEVVTALRAHPASYNAGVVGPDAYPDSLMGQAVIHPANTGAWMSHTLNKAWDAQAPGSGYSDDEKGQILAFAYGYLTHAAGDMWAHTLVNDFANGVFPGVSEILTDPAKAAIAMRHLILEGYIGDATPGFDGNSNRALVPDETNEDGDPQVSDDSTHGISFAPPPDRFLWETYIGRAADSTGKLTLPLPGQPTAERGPLIGFFYDLRNNLHEKAGTNSNWEELLSDFETLQARIDAVLYECSFPPDPIDCPVALVELGISSIDNLIPDELFAAALEEIANAYMRAWVDDIDHGLQHWGSIGQGFAAGLFDPATRRAFQDEECGELGSEGTAERAACEDGIGPISTFFYALDTAFTTGDPHLLSMLGAPDVVGDLLQAISDITEAIDDFIDFPNPISAAIAELKEYMKEKLTEALSEVLGFDVAVFVDILKNPSSYLDPLPLPIALPPPLDAFNNSGIFAAGEHERIDTLMGLPNPGQHDDHHQPNRRLDDNIEFNIADFDPLENSIVTSKLLLLSGEGMNQVLSQQLGRTVSTYPGGVRTNVMIHGLDGGFWLRSIDSDHAWRQDGAPVFCNEGSPCPAGVRSNAISRPAELNAGNGSFPIWESCVLRPVFAMLFDDWEQAAGDPEFPAYGDAVGADPLSDPNAPTSSLDVEGKQYTQPVTLRNYLGKDHIFTLTAQDSPAGQGFADSELELRYRVDGGNWVAAVQGTQFNLIGLADGLHTVEVQSGDPCHTLDESDSLAAETAQYFEFWLDTTPPVTTCAVPPFNTIWDTDDFATVDYSVSDGADGSGVKGETSLINKFEVPTGTRATFDGDIIDMYLHYPDTVTVTVTAEDFVGNAGDTGCSFELEATPGSLINNLKRARAEGDVPGTGAYNGLSAELAQVKRNHDRGKHETEWNVLDAFIGDLEAQRGKGIDLIVANRFIAYAEEIIAAGR